MKNVFEYNNETKVTKKKSQMSFRLNFFFQNRHTINNATCICAEQIGFGQPAWEVSITGE